MTAKGCNIILFRKHNKTIYSNQVTADYTRTYQKYKNQYILFTWGLLEASVLALLSLRAFPSLLVCFTLDIQCNSLLTLSPCSLFSSSTDLYNQNRWVFNNIIKTILCEKPEKEKHFKTTWLCIVNHCQFHQMRNSCVKHKTALN